MGLFHPVSHEQDQKASGPEDTHGEVSLPLRFGHGDLEFPGVDAKLACEQRGPVSVKVRHQQMSDISGTHALELLES